MELALMQAKKSCPFIHVASASSLRRLTAGSNQVMSPLMTKAKQCPIMSQAISSRSISTSNVVSQTPSKPVKATAGNDNKKKKPGLKKKKF
jgi:5-aminolevulinate synthase